MLNHVIHRHDFDIVNTLINRGYSHNQVKKHIESIVHSLMDNSCYFESSHAMDLKEILFGNLQRALVLCLSQDVRNNLMWSHYASWHQGFCIEFDSEKLINDLDLYHHAEVDYDGKPYDVLSNLLALKEDNLHPTKQICFMKASEWSYEREYRLIHKKLATKERQSIPINYEQSTVKAIYFGMNAKESDIQSLISKVKGRDLSFFIMKPEKSHTSFSLEPLKLNDTF